MVSRVGCDRVHVRDEFSDPVVGVRDLLRVARFVNARITNTIEFLIGGDAVQPDATSSKDG